MLTDEVRLENGREIANADWLRTVAALARQLNESDDISEFFHRVAYSAARVTGCSSALVIWGVDSESVTGSYGLPPDYLDHWIGEFESGENWTPVTEAWKFGNPVIIEDIEAEQRLRFWHRIARESVVRSMATFPLITRGEVLGVLSLYFTEPHTFGAAEMDAATAVADFAAAAINASLLQAERAAQLEALERHLQDRLRLEQFHQALTEASLSHEGIEALVDAASSAAGVTIAVHDPTGRTIAVGAPEGTAHLLPLFRAADPDLPAGMVVLTRPLTVQATQLGVLMLLAVESDKTSSQVLGYLGMALERELAVRAQNEQGRERVLEDLLGRLLSAEHASDLEAVRKLFASHDFDLQFPIQIAVSSMDAVDGDTEVTARVALSVRSALGQNGAFVSRLGRRLVALQSVVDREDNLGAALALALQGQRGTWTTVKFDHVDDLADLQGVIRVAGKLLDLAERRPGPSRLIDGGRLGLFHVLLEASETASLARFLDSVMGPLRDHDARHRSELVKTLRVLAANEFRHRDAADVLFIHTNTLGYRIGKIGQLIDRDLRLTSATAEVHVACILDQMISESVVADS